MRLFNEVIDAVFPPREHELLVRKLQPIDFLQRTRAVVHEALPGAPMSLLPYADEVVRANVLEAKFEGNEHAAELLGNVLADFLYELLSESINFFDEPLALVPIPLSAERLRERGYNQVERILRTAEMQLLQQFPFPLLTFSPILRRTRNTAAQTSLDGTERRKNLTGAFVPNAPVDPRRTYIMVDDVVTTGSTLSAACDALRQAGARHVMSLALAN
jgi:ComF family protein